MTAETWRLDLDEAIVDLAGAERELDDARRRMGDAEQKVREADTRRELAQERVGELISDERQRRRAEIDAEAAEREAAGPLRAV